MVHWITRVSVVGIAVITAALIILVAAFNGIEGMVERLYSEYDAAITIRSAKGKTFDASLIKYNQLQKIEGVKKEIFEVLELNINNELYLIPMKDINKVINPKKENIKGDFKDLIMEGDKVHKILDLEFFFNHELGTELENSIILIIKNDLALKVTQTGKTKQVVVKSLEKNFTSTKYFSGIAINGLGKVELILDINKLEKEFINNGCKNN